MNADITKYWPHWMRNYVWLIKRELWEHRGRLLITPLVVAGVILIGAFYGLTRIGEAGLHFDPNDIHFGDASPNNIIIGGGQNFGVFLALFTPFFFVTFVVVTYYSLDALYADRRDRSILFWKSLPLSDTETVLSKLAIAMLVAPSIAVAISIVTQLIVFVATTVVLGAQGHDAMRLWHAFPVFGNTVVLVYMLIVAALWHAPIWAWCLLASAWARRAVFLWATVPIAALWFLESRTIGTHYVASFLGTRFAGMIPLAVDLPGLTQSGRAPGASTLTLSDVLTPGRFLMSDQLWIGLAIAGALIAATVWVRRYREVI